jgi:predicted O-methyltransferase YrrM
VTQDRWTAVDRYFTDLLIPADPALDAALASIAAAGLPPINVSPLQGKLLMLLARMCGAKNILEIGTLAAYSTIWLARALVPGGRLITLESEEKHARIARANLERAGLNDTVELLLGRALETLPRLAADHCGPFDLVFIDADKPSTTEYFNWSLKLTQPGSVIIVDNVVRSGNVVDPTSRDEAVQGVRRFNEAVAKEQRVSATAIQTVGAKGYDGLAVLVVNG